MLRIMKQKTEKTPLLPEGKSTPSMEEKSRDSKVNEYISDTSWDNMPDDIKKVMAPYLLKPGIIYDQPTTKQVNIALNVRTNIDLPYVDRSRDDIFKYTKMPCITAYGDYRDFPCGGYLSRSCDDLDKGSPCHACQIIRGCVCVLPISVAHVSVCTPLGLFADCGRAIKRKCDNDKDEALHRVIVGPPHQEMR